MFNVYGRDESRRARNQHDTSTMEFTGALTCANVNNLSIKKNKQFYGNCWLQAESHTDTGTDVNVQSNAFIDRAKKIKDSHTAVITTTTTMGPEDDNQPNEYVAMETLRNFNTETESSSAVA